MKVINEKTVKIEINYNLKLIKHQCLKLNYRSVKGAKNLVFTRKLCDLKIFIPG